MVSQTASGFSHEFILAEELVSAGAGAYFSSSQTQKALALSRKRHFDAASLESPDWVNKLRGLARTSVSLLPVASGEVCFTEKSANGGEVYDIIYESNGQLIKLSAKTSNVEDKAFRFSTAGYELDFAREALNEVFTTESVAAGLSYKDALTCKGMTVASLQHSLVSTMTKIINSSDSLSDSKDLTILKSLVKDRFIGVGGFYKTLPDGSVLFYPEKDPEDSVDLIAGSASFTLTTCSFTVELKDVLGVVKQTYQISFRVKFKDGVNKPVSFAQNGMPKNIAATVKVVLV